MFKNLRKLDREFPSDRFLDHLVVSALWSQSLVKPLQYLTLIACNIQIIAILLWGQLQIIIKPEDSLFLQNLLSALKLFAAKDLFSSESPAKSVKLFIILSSLYFLLFVLGLGLIFLNFYLKRKESQFETIFITTLRQFHLSIGFWITNIMLFDALSIDHLGLDRETDNLLVFIPALILIIINYSISTFYAFFAYNPFVYYSKFSAHTPIYQVGSFLLKAVIPLTVTLTNNLTLNHWSFAIVSFLIVVYQYYQLVCAFPFYEYSAMRITLTFGAINISISGMTLFVFASDLLSPAFTLFIEFFVVLAVIRITTRHFHIIIGRYLEINEKQLTSEEEVLKRIFALRYIFSKVKVTLSGDSNLAENEIDFWGVWSSIIVRQNLLRNVSEASLVQMFRKYFNKSQQNVINIILKEAILRLKHTDKLKIMLCNLSLEYGEQIATGIYYLMALSKAEGFCKIIALKLHQKVQEKVYSFFNGELTEGKTLDLKSYMDLESVSSNFLQMIHLDAKKSVNFWETYKKPGINIKQLYDTHLQIEKEYEDILRFWRKFVENNRVFAGSLNIVYSIYMALVRNSPVLGRKILEKYNSSSLNPLQRYNPEGPLSLENLSSPHNITFYASMAKEKLGRTLYVSPNMTELLGWTQEDLRGVNVSILVPNFMQKRHDIALLQHLDKVSSGIASQRLYKNLNTFVKNKAGFDVPCYVYLSLYPYITGELIYTAIVRLRKTEANIILVNKDGVIEGFTKNVGEKFNLSPSKPVKIRDICENFKLVERVLENLSKLLNQQTFSPNVDKPKEGQEAEAGYIELPKINVDEGYNEEFAASLSQTIEAKFYPPQHAADATPTRRQHASNTYSIHITPRKIWESYFFILNLEEQVKKDFRRHTKSRKSLWIQTTVFKEGSMVLKENSIPEVPDELPTNLNFEEPFVTSTQVFSTNTSPLLKNSTPTHNHQRTQPFRRRTTYNGIYGSITKTEGAQSIPTKDLIEEEEDLSEDIEVVQKKITKKAKNKGGLLEILDLDETSVASPVMGSTHYSKVEEAVYTVPKDRGLRLIKLLTIIFVAVTVIMLINFEVQNKKVLSLGSENVSLIEKSYVLLREVCEINKMIRLLKIFKPENLSTVTENDRSRYQPFGLNVSMVGMVKDIFERNVNDLNQLNNFMRSYTYKMDAKIEMELFGEKIPIQESSSDKILNHTRHANIFGLITELVVTAIKISSAKFEASQAFKFILDNTLNDLLIYGENISIMLIKNNQTKLRNLIDFILIATISIALFSLLLLGLDIKFMRVFIRKRKQIINIFERLEINQIDKQINLITKFAHVLEENNMDSKKVSIKLEKESFANLFCKKVNAKISKKVFNTKGINRTLIIFCFIKVSLLLSMFSGNIVILQITQKQSDLIDKDTRLVASSTSYLYNLDLLSTIIYEYVDENATTIVRNHPIGEEWNRIVNNMTQVQTFLVKNFFEKDENNIVIQAMIKENLCEQLDLKDHKTINICNNIAGGVLQKGITGLMSFGLDTIQLTRMAFDESSMRNSDKMNILKTKDLVALEAILNIFGPTIYREFVDRVQTYAKQDYDGLDRIMINMVIAYVVISTLLGGIIWVWIEKSLEKEVFGWRKILRRIPYEIVVTSKAIKNYLRNNSSGLLDGVKKNI